MAETIRKVDYYYTLAPDRPGEAARLLDILRDKGINLLAFSAFPSARKSQADFVPADPAAFLTAARGAKIKLSRKKTVFLIDGDDRVGAVADVVRRLGAAKINITALDAVSSASGRYGALLWVKPRDLKRASAALGLAS